MDYNPFYLLFGLSSVVARWNSRNKIHFKKEKKMFQEWKKLTDLLRVSGVKIAHGSISGAFVNLQGNLQFNFLTEDNVESFIEINFSKNFPSVRTEQFKYIFFEDNYYRTKEIAEVAGKIAESILF